MLKMITLKRGLYSDEINDFLKKDPFFMGCFPSNKIPDISKFPCSLIVNSEKANHPGLHWYALVLHEDRCFFFDPFGGHCMEMDILEYLLRQRYKTAIHSKICIQDIMSYSCGLFCVTFVQHVHSIESFAEFIIKFSSKNLTKNDITVVDLIL